MSDQLENSGAASKTRIVIAEDSPVQALILRRALENNGYAVFPGKTGAEGLALVAAHKPALVISDVEMPDMNGFDFCRRIKGHPETQSIPVILCTSLTQPEDIIKGMEAGADGYVTKPYDERFLIMRVQAMLENRAEVLIDPKSFGSLSFPAWLLETSYSSKLPPVSSKPPDAGTGLKSAG